MIESSSRPYRYNIQKMLSIEGNSLSKSFDIEPFRTKIIDQLEMEIALWYEEIGHQYTNEPDFEERLMAELEAIQPRIIQEIGIQAMSKSIPQLFFIPEELKFEIHFSGFAPFEIEVPMAQVEAFKENFHRIKYADQQITYSQMDQFVITEINIYDPVAEAIYAYQHYNADMLKLAVFSISLPETD